jgi:hypothetical protein
MPEKEGYELIFEYTDDKMEEDGDEDVETETNEESFYTCAGCKTEIYPYENTVCNSCGQSFCPDCSTW